MTDDQEDDNTMTVFMIRDDCVHDEVDDNGDSDDNMVMMTINMVMMIVMAMMMITII